MVFLVRAAIIAKTSEMKYATGRKGDGERGEDRKHERGHGECDETGRSLDQRNQHQWCEYAQRW